MCKTCVSYTLPWSISNDFEGLKQWEIKCNYIVNFYLNLALTQQWIFLHWLLAQRSQCVYIYIFSIVGREIQLTKDYTTGNATFKQGSRGTVIEAPSRKDGKLKVKLDNDNEKTFRLIKECDLQLYEGGPLSFSSESQTAETSFEY